MRSHRTRWIVLGAALAMVVGTQAGASTKFAFTEEITASGSLRVGFEEASLKRFDVVEYRLDAVASAVWDLGGGQNVAVRSEPTAGVTLAPDARGRTAGSLTLDLGQPGGGCSCGTLQRVEYANVSLTNVTTRHVYRLDPVSLDYPS